MMSEPVVKSADPDWFADLKRDFLELRRMVENAGITGDNCTTVVSAGVVKALPQRLPQWHCEFRGETVRVYAGDVNWGGGIVLRWPGSGQEDIDGAFEEFSLSEFDSGSDYVVVWGTTGTAEAPDNGRVVIVPESEVDSQGFEDWHKLADMRVDVYSAFFTQWKCDEIVVGALMSADDGDGGGDGDVAWPEQKTDPLMKLQRCRTDEYGEAIDATGAYIASDTINPIWEWPRMS